MGSNRNPRVVFDCDYCGKEATERPSHYSRSSHHFCSMVCYAAFQRELLPKEEHNSYGHGLPVAERQARRWCRSTLNHAIRDGLIYREPCEKCGKEAEAHHTDYTRPFAVHWLCFYHHRKQAHSQRPVYENPELLEAK